MQLYTLAHGQTTQRHRQQLTHTVLLRTLSNMSSDGDAKIDLWIDPGGKTLCYTNTCGVLVTPTHSPITVSSLHLLPNPPSSLLSWEGHPSER